MRKTSDPPRVQSFDHRIAVAAAVLAVAVETFMVAFSLMWATGGLWFGLGPEALPGEAAAAGILATLIAIGAARWFSRNLANAEARPDPQP